MTQWNHTRVTANWTNNPNLIWLNLTRWKWNSLTRLLLPELGWGPGLGENVKRCFGWGQAQSKYPKLLSVTSFIMHCHFHCFRKLCDGNNGTKEKFPLFHSWESHELFHSCQHRGGRALSLNKKQTAPSWSTPTSPHQLTRPPSQKIYNLQSSITSWGSHLQNQEPFKP